MAGSRDFFYQFGKLLYQIDSFYDEFAKQSNVPGAVHCDLYDNYKYLPLDKLKEFFCDNLK